MYYKYNSNYGIVTCIISCTTVIGIATCMISTISNWDCYMYNKYNSIWDCTYIISATVPIGIVHVL